jgi:hypothetical protein
MEGRQLLQYLIDTSDVLLAKKQEATEYLAKIEAAAQHHAHLTWLESHPCNCTGDDNFCHLPSCPRYIATQVA